MVTDLILGTAGHIDHGKTSLIRALTGVDTDRLPEEKRRGITIELGFAELPLGNYRLGIVDVPGHERFVRNMLAGATGMDLALLVVAADDSVKPQTREHLEILRLLHLTAGVIAITKCDLVEPEWIDLVEEEIRDLVRGTFLEHAPLVRTSVETGSGLVELKEHLQGAAEQVVAGQSREGAEGPFRMAIDRTFTVAGHGTVVTGSVSRGQCQLGEQLVIQPAGIEVRVRSLQNHDRTVQQVQRGQRAAINLGGVHHDEIHRGQELASPGHLLPSRLLTVKLSVLPSAPRPLKSRSRARLHVGTAEVMASVRLLDRNELPPGHSGFAQLFLGGDVVCTWRQPFVVRSESPVVTIGGGVVLDSNAQKIRKVDELDLQMIRRMESPDVVMRASAALYLNGLRPWDPADLARMAGIESVDSVCQQLREQGELREIRISPQRSVALHEQVFQRLCQRIEVTLRKLHDLQPLRTTIDRDRLTKGFRYLGGDVVLNSVLQDMAQRQRVRLSGNGVGLVGQGPKLSQNEQKLLQQLIVTYREAGMQAPSVEQLQTQTTRNQQSVPQLIALAAAEGHLVQISPQYFLHTEVDQQLRQTLAARFAQSDGLTLSQIREILNTTRKYAVPYCEYLDRIGFTRRNGDLRMLADAAPKPP